MTLQTRVPENFRQCRWGAERRVLRAQTREQGPPSALAEFLNFPMKLLTSGKVFPYVLNMQIFQRLVNTNTQAELPICLPNIGQMYNLKCFFHATATEGRKVETYSNKGGLI